MTEQIKMQLSVLNTNVLSVLNTNVLSVMNTNVLSVLNTTWLFETLFTKEVKMGMLLPA